VGLGFPAGLALLAGFLGTMAAAHAQDLDAGKSAPKLFAANCTACHRNPQGLSARLGGRGVASFLRTHYTSSRQTAEELAGYLASVGGDARAARVRAEPESPQQRPQDRAQERPQERVQERPPERIPQGAAQPAEVEAPEATPQDTRRARAAERARLAAAEAERQRRRDRRNAPEENLRTPASVSTDPEPIVISSAPVPLRPSVPGSRRDAVASRPDAVSPAEAPSASSVAVSRPSVSDSGPAARSDAAKPTAEPDQAPIPGAPAPGVNASLNAAPATPATAAPSPRVPAQSAPDLPTSTAAAPAAPQPDGASALVASQGSGPDRDATQDRSPAVPRRPQPAFSAPMP
jgi:hypothetical protein